MFRRAIAASPGVALCHYNLGKVLLESGAHAACIEAFGEAARLIGRPAGRLAVYRNSDIDERQAAGERGYVGTVENVLVDTGFWSIFDHGRIYNRETMTRRLINNPLIAGRVKDDESFVVADLPPATRKIERPCVFLGGDENYSHWLTRNLARLSLLESRPDLSALPFLVNEDLRPYQRDALDMLDIPDERLIKVPRGQIVECALLHVPTVLRGAPPRLRPGIEWLRRRLAVADTVVPAGDEGRRLFVSREDAARRRQLNETALIAALRPFGFEVIVPGLMSFREQIRAFSEASFVVGAHGAAMTNLLFAPRGCKVVEIAPKPIAYMDDFRVIAECLDQPFEALVTDDLKFYAKVNQPMSDYDFNIDVGTVVDTVSRTLARQ